MKRKMNFWIFGKLNRIIWIHIVSLDVPIAIKTMTQAKKNKLFNRVEVLKSACLIFYLHQVGLKKIHYPGLENLMLG